MLLPALQKFMRGAVWPVFLFFLLYICILVAGSLLLPREDIVALNGVALVASLLATWGANRIHDGGQWRIGFGGGGAAVREIGLGLAAATAIIGVTNALIVLTTDFHHVRGAGVDWYIILALFVPAAIHEEVVFRGYPFQKVAAWNRPLAVFGWSALFAAVHLGNEGVSALGTLNIFLAGVLLSLAYLAYRRLWLPVALHVWWNVLSGPLLGHEVSGLALERTLLGTVDPGPDLLTGGSFGLEASIWATLVEGIAIIFLFRLTARNDRLTALRAASAPGPESPAPHETSPAGLENQ
jgi:uncharacterized protein